MECMTSKRMDLAEKEVDESQHFDHDNSDDQISEVSFMEQNQTSDSIESVVLADEYSVKNVICNEMAVAPSKPTSDKCGRICYICKTTSDFYCQNLYKTKSKHSNTRICDFIKKWSNKLKFKDAINAVHVDQKDDHCICVDCFNRINEYDSLYTAAERKENELCEIFLKNTEQMASIEPKVELTEECPQIFESILNPISGDSTELSKDFDDEDDDVQDTLSDDENDEMLETSDKKVVFECTKCNMILNR